MGQATSGATLQATDPGGDRPCDATAGQRLLAFVDRRRWWLFGFAAVLYLVGFTGVYHPEADSALYLTLGKNLATGHGFTYQDQVNRVAYPGYPWLLAGLFRLFGTQSLFAHHLAMLALTGATLAMVYLLIRLHAGRPMAVLVTLNLALAEEMYAHAYQLRNDVPFLLGAVAFLVGYEALARHNRPGAADRGASTAVATAATGPAAAEPTSVPGGLEYSVPARSKPSLLAAVGTWILMLAGLGVAVTMRPTMWALVAAIVLGTIWTVVARQGRVRKRHLAAAAVVVAAVVLFYLLDPRKTGIEGQYEQTVGEALSEPGQMVQRVLTFRIIEAYCTAASEAMFGHELGRGVDWLLMLWFLPAMLVVTYRRPLWFFYLAGTLAMLLALAQLSLPNYPGQLGQLVPRHFLGVLPLMIYAGWMVVFAAERKFAPKFARWVVPVAVAMAFLPNLAKICETAYRQRAYAAAASAGQSETDAYEELGRVLPTYVPKDATLLVPRKEARIVTYYSGLRVRDAAPTLSVSKIPGPVYVLENGEPSIARFVEREKLELGPSLATVPGRRAWRGGRQPDWTLRRVMNH